MDGVPQSMFCFSQQEHLHMFFHPRSCCRQHGGELLEVNLSSEVRLRLPWRGAAQVHTERVLESEPIPKAVTPPPRCSKETNTLQLCHGTLKKKMAQVSFSLCQTPPCLALAQYASSPLARNHFPVRFLAPPLPPQKNRTGLHGLVKGSRPTPAIAAKRARRRLARRVE